MPGVDSLAAPRLDQDRGRAHPRSAGRTATPSAADGLLAGARPGRLPLRGDGLLAILLAEDGRAIGARRAPRTPGSARLLRRLRALCGAPGIARHRHATLPVRAFLDHEHLGLDVALDATRRADLEAPAAVDVALVVAVDDHVVRLDRGADARLGADDQRPLALDLALGLAFDAEVAIADVLPVEAGVGVDHALVAGVSPAELSR